MSLILIVILAIAIVLLGVIAALSEKNRQRLRKAAIERGEEVEDDEIEIPDDECCGMHITCEKESLLVAVNPSIVYFDDEELDRFKGTNSDEYDSDAISEFEEILSTLLETDVPAWIRSLQMRGIELPESVKAEALLIVSEHRIQHSHYD